MGAGRQVYVETGPKAPQKAKERAESTGMEVKVAAATPSAVAADKAPKAASTPTPKAIVPVLTRKDSASASLASSFDAWLLQKLKSEWSSRDFGALLTAGKLAEARASFPSLEMPIKVRLLLSLLSVRREAAEEGKAEITALVQLAETDSEEWVKVAAGMVKRFLALSPDNEPADSYLRTQLSATVEKVMEVVAKPPKESQSSSSMPRVALDDFFSLENAMLNPSLRPQLAPSPTTHFTVAQADDDDANDKDGDVDERVSSVKRPLQRPQMARPLPHPSSSASGSVSTVSSVSGSRLGSQATAKPPMMKKKKPTELSSEIRRKADAGRFKRQRSRISMIDIDEVKQIESEKAQKAEERKKQKLAAKEKEKAASAGAAAAGTTASEEKGDDGEEANGSVAAEEEHADAVAETHGLQQHEGENTLESPQATTEHAEETHNGQHEHVDGVERSGEEYAADGTQALLNAAFHSTQDIMKEVVNQQSQQLQQERESQPVFQQMYHPPPQQQQQQSQQMQMQMHHLAPPQQFHRGFEPEDATGVGGNMNTGAPQMGYGGYGYGATPGYYGDQFGAYAAQDNNPYGAAGYATNVGLPEPTGNLPPLGGRLSNFDSALQQQQQQQQQQLQQQQRHHQQNNGGYMDGSGEYWR